jgi:hypothetical protein
MLTKMIQKLIKTIHKTITLIISLGLLWAQSPIVAWAQYSPTPVAPQTVLLQQLNDKSAPQPMSDTDRANLQDPFFQLVLKNHVNIKTLTEVQKLLKPESQSVFVVDERIVDPTPKLNHKPAERRGIMTMTGKTANQLLDRQVILAIGFNSSQFPTANFIEAMAWDDQNSLFNYYKFDQLKTEAAPTWKFRGNSRDADLLTASARQGTCMQCHINGAAVMKELELPWNNWHSLSDPIDYLSGGNGWPIANAADSPLKSLGGAEDLETGTVMPTISTFNQRRIEQLTSRDGNTIVDARRLLKPLFLTTEFNLISSRNLSPLHPFAKSGSRTDAITVPTSFFLNRTLLRDLDIRAKFSDFATITSQDYTHLVRQTKTTIASTQPGDTNFAWFVPEPSFIDNDLVKQLMGQNIVPPEFVAAVLAIDLENPVFSSDRAKLWSDKVLPATFKIAPTNDLIPQVVKNLTALKPTAGTPEAILLARLQQPDKAIATLQQQVTSYVDRERSLLGNGAKPEVRSREWIRLYKLALQRREAILKDPILQSLDETDGKLLLARGDQAVTIAALPSTTPTIPTNTSPPRLTLRLGDRGEDVAFLQQRLKAMGLYSGAIDADFGRQTQTAVIAAQKRLGLNADGIVGNVTWGALSTSNNIA